MMAKVKESKRQLSIGPKQDYHRFSFIICSDHQFYFLLSANWQLPVCRLDAKKNVFWENEKYSQVTKNDNTRVLR